MTTNLLGTYLKDRRGKLDPAALGFPLKRRRTPGLRREEVAHRANVSATWYTWLEQGRGGAPSADVVDRIARADAHGRRARAPLPPCPGPAARGPLPGGRGCDDTTAARARFAGDQPCLCEDFHVGRCRVEPCRRGGAGRLRNPRSQAA